MAIHVDVVGNNDNIATIATEIYGLDDTDIYSYTGNANVTMYGGSGDDLLTTRDATADGNDHLYGEDGADFLKGFGGNDYLDGGEGNDSITAGAGDDTAYGGDGDDAMTGGTSVPDGFSPLTADPAETGTGNDIMYGGGGNDLMLGGDGNDQLDGDAGNDIIDGGDGNDDISAGAGEDNLKGGAGNDTLVGGGGTGTNTINGGLGIDLLIGGGAITVDKFVFDTGIAPSGSNFDTIANFVHDIDEIHLSQAIFAKAGPLNGNLAPGKFNVIGPGEGPLDANDRVIYNEVNGKLFYDANGVAPGQRTVFAQLTGSPDNIDNTDFLVIA